MKQSQLAEELRQGHCWKYADGLVAKMVPGEDKATASEWKLVKLASTCHECGRSATTEEIETAVSLATDYESFASLIYPQIEHAMECEQWEDEECEYYEEE